MPDLNIRELSVENIRSRMIRNAARIWGAESEDIESTFDPMVTMLVEACSYELSKINTEILDTQTRVLERLAQVLSPGIYTGPQPAYSVAHARALEPESILNKYSQFYAQKKIINADQKEENKEIYFSPVKPVKIFDAVVKYTAAGKTIYEYKNPVARQPVADAAGYNSLPPNEIWIAIEVHNKIASFENFVFYFDWKNDPDEERYLQLLPLTKWYLGEQELKVEKGIKQNHAAQNKKDNISTQYDVSLRIEKFVENLFESHFYTVQPDASEGGLQQYIQSTPPAFEGTFSKEALAKIQGRYVWLRMHVSGAIRPSALNDVYVSINSLPVINRKVNKITYQLKSNLNIVPLRTDENFFDMMEVQNSEGKYFESNPLESGFRNEGGYYTLRYSGVERFDKRSATEFLQTVIDLVRDESASFSSLGNEFINNYISQVNQSIAMIENRLGTKGEKSKPSHFIIINPLKNNENVFIRYWSTSGMEGNQVKAGSKLNLSTGADVKSDSCILLLTTAGGKQSLGDNEKISAFRRSILTHDRIVTQEDIITFCYHEIGNLISSVVVRKNWNLSSRVSEGMVRIIEVMITPAKSQNLTAEEWQNLATELETKITHSSNDLIPMKVIIQ